MKKNLVKSLLACVVFLACMPCWSCPDGYYSGPLGTCLPNAGAPAPAIPTPAVPPLGVTCVTTAGYCRLSVPSPVGAACYCSANGQNYVGFVQ
jgi:hypothetical protein